MSLAAPLAALLLGALGSGHCVAMCGGFAALGSAPASSRPVRRLAGPEPLALGLVVAQHVGRLASYALLGAAAGGLGGWALRGPFARYGATTLELLAGATLLFAGLALTGLAKSPLERLGAPIFRRIAPWTRRLVPLRSAPQALAFGAAWGLLPCGLVYSATALAAASGSAPLGALGMVAFGLGTLPTLVAVAVLARRVARAADLVRRPAVRIAAGLAFVVWGGLHVENAAAAWGARDQGPTCACHHRG